MAGGVMPKIAYFVACPSKVNCDKYYQEKVWRMFGSIDKINQTGFTNAAISDVVATDLDDLPHRDDRMESFWPVETLKYFYLIFSEPDLVTLDEYVVITKAHPLQRPT
ncbi:uncharacterized protein A1O5_11492 [Cladophialophora psammophila CBS 110553]|uniref:Uncharacterized protein n=1 Tax=Cladophialophora psammophila CBS 110553 TaxID=1182543 RepID=W9W663_9EURO|nr:uncharacterized protein A1O5_11492 [Cladophialophora psammophila CBS 110553]EXJ63443.1 hypothetical protein A1O5_11492 [Cladophialophora psammophila CBS 110553]